MRSLGAQALAVPPPQPTDWKLYVRSHVEAGAARTINYETPGRECKLDYVPTKRAKCLLRAWRRG